MKIAIIHDWLNQVGGAEDVLDVLMQRFPGAPLYTSIYWRDKMPVHYQQWKIHTTWLDRLPGIHRNQQPYLPLYPLAFSKLKVAPIDVLLSNKSGFCIGVPKPTNARHICYCLAPTRYIWDLPSYIARERYPAAVSAILHPWALAMQRWERRAAQQVDAFIAISREIQQRIQRFYKRTATIIYPPVETTRFAAAHVAQPADYFLIVSRLIPYKRIDLAVQACTRLGLPLKIAGRGRDLERLRAMAGPSVEFLGYVPNDDLPSLMANCRAFLFPGLEDFGITPVQALAAGRPVIAFEGGGALDYVVPDQTGILFSAQTVESLENALQQFDAQRFNAAIMQAFARQFDRAIFESKLLAFIDQTLQTGLIP